MIIFTTIILVVPVVLWLVNWLWFRPLDKKKNLEDVGYIVVHVLGRNQKGSI